MKYILSKIEDKGEGILFFQLKPKHPDDAILVYNPGQFITLYIHEDERRAYSLMNLPNENKILDLGIKLAGSFTHQLWKLKEGDEINVDGPFGNYNFFKDEPIVLIAGGIGISPILSYLRYVDKNNISKNRNIIMFYSDRTLNSMVHYPEVKKICEQNNISCIFIFTKQDDAPGEHERINDSMIKKYVKSPNEYIYFVCGSLGFNKGINETLLKCGVDEDVIHLEGG